MKPRRMSLVMVAALTATLTALALPGPACGQADAIPPRGCALGDIIHQLTPTLYSIEPLAGFDPLTVGNETLACYGFEPRPTNAQDLQAWTDRMRHFHYVVPQLYPLHALVPPAHLYDDRADASPPRMLPVNRTAPRRPLFSSFGARIPRISAIHPDGLTSNEGAPTWTGYDILSRDNNNEYFRSVAADYTVPTVTYYPDQSTLSAWVGLGGDNVANPDADVLWQAGVVTVADPQYKFFVEDAGCTNDHGYRPPPPCPAGSDGAPGTPIVLSAPTVRTGDLVHVSVAGDLGTYYVENETTHQSSGLRQVSINNINTGLSADFVVENSGLNPFARWTNPYFHLAQAQGVNRGFGWIDQWNYNRIDFCPQGLRFTRPSPVDPTNHAFSVSYDGTYIGPDNCVQYIPGG